MTPTLKIGTRYSALALAQTELVAQRLRAAGMACELVHVTTAGDRSSAPVARSASAMSPLSLSAPSTANAGG